ncbi:F0F1 ATP synthase subunit epsilon [Romboutsia weinsteinii]|uniref:F0F1 ATP synthase subunit epsilon n=1 Tax=Romboutsia weinsteinii TaxID=2020949 RepID=A0A371J055_9FIRM|nr:F0F1 ATP synthase subunit epsilon [Romboutsia weinsteinii]RDY26105.1 F0F1 ATP synthase subunit epsilon [Romboutsia weinsteinii]
MASEFALQVVTPDTIFYDDQVEMIITRTTNGDRGILKGHIPFVAGLVEGNLRIKKDGKFKDAKIAGGFVTVDKEKTVILTESAEWL